MTCSETPRKQNPNQLFSVLRTPGTENHLCYNQRARQQPILLIKAFTWMPHCMHCTVKFPRGDGSPFSHTHMSDQTSVGMHHGGMMWKLVFQKRDSYKELPFQIIFIFYFLFCGIFGKGIVTLYAIPQQKGSHTHAHTYTHIDKTILTALSQWLWPSKGRL